MNFEENSTAVPERDLQTAEPVQQTQPPPKPTKFCSHCGASIDKEAVVCPKCGCQVEQTAAATPNIVINNSNANSNVNQNTVYVGAGQLKKEKNKWVAVLLCIFLGALGGHKFYEGKIGMGILYLFTLGLFGIGVFIDFIVLLFKPNPYYV